MRQNEPSLFTGAHRVVTGFVIVFLTAAAFLAFLNSQKIRVLRTSLATAQAGRDAAEQRRTSERLSAPAKGADEQRQLEDRATKAEAELAQAQKERNELQAKLDSSEQQIASTNAHDAELQSQLDDLRHQVDGAEKEKALLAEKMQDAQARPTQSKDGKKRSASGDRDSASAHRTGVRGTVLAYNQAYNFVVLNLGARNGVEPNSEMLVLRDGTLIGKIRISSVEPATAIGDIITNSLARGVQVQSGDTVIYAGTNP